MPKAKQQLTVEEQKRVKGGTIYKVVVNHEENPDVAAEQSLTMHHITSDG